MVIFADSHTLLTMNTLKREIPLKQEVDDYCMIAWKLCKIQRKLLLFASRKWYIRFLLYTRPTSNLRASL